MVVRSRMRFAEKACVLAAGLLMFQGAVAIADPGSGGDGGANVSVPGLSEAGRAAGNIADHVTDTVGQTVQGVTGPPGSARQPGPSHSTGPTSTLGSGRQPGQQQPSTGATRPATGAGVKDTDDQVDAGLVSGPAGLDPIGAVLDAVPPVTNARAPGTDVPVSTVLAPAADVVAPVADVVAPLTDVVAPVADVVAPLTDVVAPVTGVIAPGLDVLTPVAGAVVTLTQPVSDLSSFLWGVAGMVPAGDDGQVIDDRGVAAEGGAPVASPVLLGPPLAGMPGAPVAATARHDATLDVTTLGRVSAMSGMELLARDDAAAVGTEPSYRSAGELLLIASLWALAAAALPGVGGLVVATAVGVRIAWGKPRPRSDRTLRTSRASPVPRSVKQWMTRRVK